MTSKKRKITQKKNSIEMYGGFMERVVSPVPQEKHHEKDENLSGGRARDRSAATKETETKETETSEINLPTVILAFPRGSARFQNRSFRVSDEVANIIDSGVLGFSKSQTYEQLLRLGLLKLSEIISDNEPCTTTGIIPIPDIFQNLAKKANDKGKTASNKESFGHDSTSLEQ